MFADIPRALWFEATSKSALPRKPEQELVMNDTVTVADYTSCGAEGGALYGPYLYNAAQVSMRVRPGENVLDLGCGSGHLINLIAKWNPQTHFEGIDLAPNMLAEAQSAAQAQDIQNVSFSEGDFSKLDGVADGSIDAVVSSMALHHLPDRAGLSYCFDAINRVLRPDGAIYLMDFGRLRNSRSLEIFVAKVAVSETQELTQDYRASLHAAFTPKDFETEIARMNRPGVALHRTPLAPLAMVVATRPLRTRLPETASFAEAVRRLSHTRRAELAQLRMFLSLGGLRMPR